MTTTDTDTDPEVRRELVDTVRRFIAREVAPVASEMEHADAYPEAIVEQMKALGLFGIAIPEAYGGLGLDLLTYIGVVEELAYGWMSLSGIVNTHTIAAHLIVHHGTEEQKQRWLPRMASGELRGCLSLSEADAGSDTRNLSCRAVRDGDEYVVTGTKMWVTNGERAGIVALAVRTEEGISCLIVEKEPGPRTGGITVSRNIGKLGYKGIETVEMTYDGHRVPADALLGDAGRGLGYILGALEVGRINIAARAVGVARAAFDAAFAYAQERRTMGKPIAEHQAIQMKIADMATKLEAARLLTRNAAERKQSGERADVEAGMAKLFASETAFEVATEALRIHGGVGYTTELPVERYYRDAPLMIIGEGTNEIQRLVIARGLLARASANTAG
jgi:alkylation response protein AidB-like acyl-CoA dehydrogenase